MFARGAHPAPLSSPGISERLPASQVVRSIDADSEHVHTGLATKERCWASGAKLRCVTRPVLLRPHPQKLRAQQPILSCHGDEIDLRLFSAVTLAFAATWAFAIALTVAFRAISRKIAIRLAVRRGSRSARWTRWWLRINDTAHTDTLCILENGNDYSRTALSQRAKCVGDVKTLRTREGGSQLRVHEKWCVIAKQRKERTVCRRSARTAILGLGSRVSCKESRGELSHAARQYTRVEARKACLYQKIPKGASS